MTCVTFFYPAGRYCVGMNEPKKIHPIQKLMDNPWLLLALGIIIPSVSYTLWGWLELIYLKAAQLP